MIPRLGWLWWLMATFGASALATSCGEARRADSSPEVAAGGSAGAPGRDTRYVQRKLGQRCENDLDCGSGLSCLAANEDFMDDQGAPAGGLCTAACGRDADCQDFDPDAVCAALSEAPLSSAEASAVGPRLCMLGCQLGAPAGETKCHGRLDLACRPFAPQVVEPCGPNGSCPTGEECFREQCRKLACGPRCNDDRDCGSGRYCDPLTGLCSEHQPAPVPLGGECDTRSEDCGAGICVEFKVAGVAVKTSCSQSCTIGERCAEGRGACVSTRFTDFAVGDIAYCLETCDCNDDCSNSADGCYAWGDPELERVYGRTGVCDYSADGEGTVSCDEVSSAGAASQ